MDKLRSTQRTKVPSAFIRLPFEEMPQAGLLRLRDVITITGLQKSAIYARSNQGKFPAPEKLTSHASAWRVKNIRAWLEDPIGWKADAANDNTSREG